MLERVGNGWGVGRVPDCLTLKTSRLGPRRERRMVESIFRLQGM